MVSEGSFQTYSVIIYQMGGMTDANLYNASIVRSGLNLFCYIKGHHPLEGDGTPRLVLEASSKPTNVEFVPNNLPENFSDLK